jgi:chorismate synthase
MASNFFGTLFRITTFGESHGPAIGVVIDGCPAGLSLTKEDIDKQLFFRRPGKTPYTSPRLESDQSQILSGVFEGKTTGAPIAILIANEDANPSQYNSVKDLYRPGHANFTYLQKYGVFDYRGGGRASARETAARVAAGAVAKKLLSHHGISCTAFLSQVGSTCTSMENIDYQSLRENTYQSAIFCPDKIAEKQIEQTLLQIKEEGDSIGGIVSCIANIPAGLGEPIYFKLEALLASAMLSLPASKGFEIGEGFACALQKGSEHNDSFEIDQNQVRTSTNRSGGTLGGISTGSNLFFRTAFKPTSSIKKPMQTVSLSNQTKTLQLPQTARHDPCIAIRAVPVVEAMTSLVLADLVLMKQSSLVQSP